MKSHRLTLPFLFCCLGLPTFAQELTAIPDVLVIPKGSTFGVQITCTGCDAPEVTESIHAAVDDTNYATVDPSQRNVVGDPFVSIFNVKGENQGGTILRLTLSAAGGPVIAQVNVTIQVTEDFDDDCLFDDLTLTQPDRRDLLGTFRQFRDDVLAESLTGMRYATLYYRHSPEVISILRDDPELRAEVQDLMRAHLRDIQSVLGGGTAILTAKELSQVDHVLELVKLQAGPVLQLVLAELQSDLTDHKKMLDLGLKTRRSR